jgi:tRNA pseudouridine13 synthase
LVVNRLFPEDLPRGRIKDRPEDFVVEEIPAYAPSGAGEHIFVRFTKRNLTTIDAVDAIARALSCDARNVGFAGMKDKCALATQTISIHTPRGVEPSTLASRAQALSLDGIVVREATPHGHKLKAGHLEGNRFAITVRDIARERLEEVTGTLDRIAEQGVPNAFGTQRFGVGGTMRSAPWPGCGARTKARAIGASSACSGRRCSRLYSTPSWTHACATERGHRRWRGTS